MRRLSDYKLKCKFFVVMILVILNTFLLFFGLNWSKTAITFLEYEASSNGVSESYRELRDNDKLEFSFVMPYGIFNSISFAVNDFGITNNGSYAVEVYDLEGQRVFAQNFNASIIPEDGMVRIRAPKNIAVKNGELYNVVVTPINNNGGDTKIGFYYDEGKLDDDHVYYRVYGGEYRIWWTGLACFVSLYLYCVLIYALFVMKKHKKLREDRFFKALLFFGLIFALSSVFSVASGFTDEFDNMRGGLIIADGAILYKDYITQHTPFVYYLCSLFAALGAESVFQFRIMFYICVAFVWMLIFLRYGQIFRESRVIMLGITIICVLFPLFDYDEFRVLSDNVQVFCFVVLLFEFIMYYREKEHTLGWVRSCIVMLCIYLSVGSAFNSVYTLASFALGFLVVEIKYWRSTELAFSKIIARYYRFVISMTVPMVLVAFYFKINGALEDMIEQAYLFNTNVYSDYLKGGYGSNIIAPFLYGIQNYLFAIKDYIMSFLHWQITYENAVFSIFIFVSIYAVIKQLRNKEYLIPFLVMAAICFSFSRDGFHTISAWGLIVFSGIVFLPIKFKSFTEWQWFIIGPVVLFMFVPYFKHAKSFLLYETPTITETEKYVIDSTVEGEGIFLSAYVNDSLFYQYKGRKIINRAAYILPWYAVWYEQATVDDLKGSNPNVVIYDPDVNVWGIEQFAPKITEQIENNYKKSNDYPLVWTKT